MLRLSFFASLTLLASSSALAAPQVYCDVAYRWPQKAPALPIEGYFGKLVVARDGAPSEYQTIVDNGVEKVTLGLTTKAGGLIDYLTLSRETKDANGRIQSQFAQGIPSETTGVDLAVETVGPTRSSPGQGNLNVQCYAVPKLPHVVPARGQPYCEAVAIRYTFLLRANSLLSGSKESDYVMKATCSPTTAADGTPRQACQVQATARAPREGDWDFMTILAEDCSIGYTSTSTFTKR